MSVVIPTKNEARNIAFVLREIPQWVSEVVLVDSSSADDTVRIAQSVRPDIVVVNEPRLGKGRALRSGFEACTGDIIVMIDADGSMNPQEIHGYIGLLLSGVDLVKGSRFAQGGGSADIDLLRRFGNGVFTLTVKLLFGGRYTDLCYGYSAFWRDVLPRLDLDAEGFEIETMINIRALRAGLTIAEVPSFESRRLHGESNLRPFRDGVRVLRVIMSEARAIRRRRSSLGSGEGAIGSVVAVREAAAFPEHPFQTFDIDLAGAATG